MCKYTNKESENCKKFANREKNNNFAAYNLALKSKIKYA